MLERLRARDVLAATSDGERQELRARRVMRLAALGSGSDFSPFLQHVGIASLDVSYAGEASGGAYHSAYDSSDRYTRFDDPGFDYGIALAKTAGRMVLRMANADSLPFEASTFADAVARYATEVQQLADAKRSETEEHNRVVREKTMEIAADPETAFVAPKELDIVPALAFAPLANAVARLRTSARAFDAATAKSDRAVMRLEQALTRADGLPNRPWYRHQIYAPGYYTGYSVKTLPGIREAIEQRKWSEANEQIRIVAGVLDGYAAALEGAAR